MASLIRSATSMEGSCIGMARSDQSATDRPSGMPKYSFTSSKLGSVQEVFSDGTPATILKYSAWLSGVIAYFMNSQARSGSAAFAGIDRHAPPVAASYFRSAAPQGSGAIAHLPARSGAPDASSVANHDPSMMPIKSPPLNATIGSPSVS